MYISKYSNGKKVSDAQYITEIICEHKAKRDKKDLHYRFWLNKEWEKFFKSQIASAHKLLKQYGAQAIVAALNNPRTRNTYSLRSKYLKPIIESEQKILDNKNNSLSKEIERISDPTSFRKVQVKKNILSNLEDIDNEH
tara:strand:+ start:83 stop:499 length:417 start_codon:yes stop_codon:yes gene_type:complete